MDKVTIVCYGRKEVMDRNDAIRLYAEGVAVCDGSEKEKYANILSDLVMGMTVCTDE